MEFFDDNDNIHLHPEAEEEYERKIEENCKILEAADVLEPPLSAYTSADDWPIDMYKNTIGEVMCLVSQRKHKMAKGIHEIVFVWDIEEITMLASDYIKWFIAREPAFRMDLFNTLIERVLTKANLSQSTNQENLINIEDSALKYKKLERFYRKISDGMREYGPIIDYGLVKKCGMIEEVVELYMAAEQVQITYENRWNYVKPCLKVVNEKSHESHKKYENVVLCEDGIAHGVAQLLISGSSKYIPIKNIYSTCKVAKKTVFERIQKRFGEKCVLVYVTSKEKKDAAIQTLQIPIMEIVSQECFKHIYTVQRDVLLR